MPHHSTSFSDDLSPRQAEVLDVIRRAVERRGFPPTYREIGDALGISSTNGVADHVKALVRKGYIRKARGGAARGLQLTELAGLTPRGDTIHVPLVGTVAAGLPMLAEQNMEDGLQLDASMVSGTGRFFALRVRGDSMMEEGILEGDMVIVREQATVKDGDIVVALIDGEATVKFYFREHDRIRLQPAHPTMAPIIVEQSSEVGIQGIVVGVWRQY
jgi:repressor LexA